MKSLRYKDSFCDNFIQRLSNIYLRVLEQANLSTLQKCPDTKKVHSKASMFVRQEIELLLRSCFVYLIRNLT